MNHACILPERHRFAVMAVRRAPDVSFLSKVPTERLCIGLLPDTDLPVGAAGNQSSGFEFQIKTMNCAGKADLYSLQLSGVGVPGADPTVGAGGPKRSSIW